MLIPIGFFGAGGAAGSYELISTTVLGSDTASVTFTNSGAWDTYKHLQLRLTIRDNYGATEGYLKVTANGLTSGYGQHELLGNGSSVSSSGSGSLAQMYLGYLPGSSATANVWAAHIIDILDHAGTKNKTLRAFGGFALSGNNRISLSSGLVTTTSALSSVTVSGFGSTMKTGSRLSIYGIKG